MAIDEEVRDLLALMRDATGLERELLRADLRRAVRQQLAASSSAADPLLEFLATIPTRTTQRPASDRPVHSIQARRQCCVRSREKCGHAGQEE